MRINKVHKFEEIIILLSMVIFLERKKIFMCLIGIFCFTALMCSNYVPTNTLQVSSTPISSKVIILDAGHGVPDGGAESKNGITEEKINLDIVLKLQNLLEETGSTVILTRSDENGIYDLDKKTLKDKKNSDLENRVKICNEASADILISVHLNKGENPNYSGWQTFYKPTDQNGKMLASCIQKSIGEAVEKENKRKENEISGIYLMENIEIPTVIVECGFLSNENEEKDLINEEYQNKVAWGIYMGILDYFEK